MKKTLAVLLVLAAIVSLASCGWKLPVKSGAEQALPSLSPSAMPAVTPSPGTSANNTAVRTFVAGEPTVSEVGKYITKNTSGFTPADGDMLLERLLLLQLDVTFELNRKIYNDTYMSVLTKTMKGKLDPSKISVIQDTTVKNDFQTIADGLMTIVFYEETPSVETDWAALRTLQGSFSPSAAFMIEYRSRLQSNFYSNEKTGLDAMAADITAIEKEFPKTGSGFIRWQLHVLYERLAATLLIGPEGEYIGDFAAGKQDAINRLNKYAGIYQNFRLGKTCKALLNLQGDNRQAATDMVKLSTAFTPDNARTLEVAARTENGISMSLPRIKEDNMSALTKQINTAVDSAAKSMLLSGKSKQKVDSSCAVCGNYLSVTISYSYAEKDGRNGYAEKNLVFDLQTGKTVTLDDLTAKAFDAYKNVLLKAMRGENTPPNIKPPVNFALNDTGIVITLMQNNSAYPDSYTITLNGLRGIMDVSQLY